MLAPSSPQRIVLLLHFSGSGPGSSVHEEPVPSKWRRAFTFDVPCFLPFIMEETALATSFLVSLQFTIKMHAQQRFAASHNAKFSLSFS